MRQPIIRIPIHILNILTQIGFEAVTTTSTIPSPHHPLRIKAIPDKLESPLRDFNDSSLEYQHSGCEQH